MSSISGPSSTTASVSTVTPCAGGAAWSSPPMYAALPVRFRTQPTLLRACGSGRDPRSPDPSGAADRSSLTRTRGPAGTGSLPLCCPAKQSSGVKGSDVAPETLGLALPTAARSRVTMSATAVLQITTIESLRHQLGDQGGDIVRGLIDLYLVQAAGLVDQICAAGAAADLE